MQTANNTNNYTVEGLVAKYRNFVEDNTPKVREFDGVEFFDAPSSIVDSNPDQQLIVSLYKYVAGKKADKKVLGTLAEYEQHFYKDALDSEEFAFLCENFEEVIAYEFSHRQEWGGMHEVSRFWFSYNCNNMKGLIHDKIHIKNGMTVFIPNSGYCDTASLFKGCIVKGYSTKIYDPNDERSKSWQKDSSEIWALGQIRLFAAGIQSEILPCYNQDLIEIDKESVDIIVCDYANFIFWDCIELYQLLKTKGQMYVFAKRDDLIDCSKHKKYLYDDLLVRTKNSSDFIKELSESIKSERAKDTNSLYDLKRKLFLNMIIEDKTIKSLVAFQEDNIILGWSEDRILIEVDKNQHSTVYAESINRGEKAEFDIAELESDMLWPGYYMVKRPQNGKPLSSLVRVFNTKGENVKQYWDRKAKKVALSGDVKVLMPREASANFAEACLSENDFRSVSDPMFEGWESKFICPNQHGVCIYMSSKGMLLWYVNEDPTDKYVCVDIIPYLVPKKGVDHRYIAALLLTPEVKQQVEFICDGTITTYTMSLILDKIIVPNHTPKQRMQFLADASYSSLLSARDKMEKEFDEKFNKMKTEYINEVRMRKHDIRPHLRQIRSLHNLMLHYLENINDIEELKESLKKKLVDCNKAIVSTSELVDHLADEERFGEPERLNLEKFLKDYIINHRDECFSLQYCNEAIKHNGGDFIFKLMELAENSGLTLEQFVKKIDCSDENNIKILKSGDYILSLKKHANDQGLSIEQLVSSNTLYVNIAPFDLKRLVDNIILNASRHGFDKKRNDYFISINVKTDVDRDMYQIDFCNNGNPLPIGMNKERYGLKGEKAGINAGTGRGGYIVKSIVEHYGGDYDVFSNGDITTIRIYLPKYSI